MKTIMVLAGGKFQLPLCQRVKKMGYRLVSVNPYKDSPCFQYADEIVQEDVLNQETVLQAAKHLKVDAVITDQTDVAVGTAAYVADRMGLPGLPLDKVELFTNKFEMRKFSARNGFPCPAYCLCRSGGEAVAFFKQLNLPAIMKPTNAQSSRGVFLIRSTADIQEHFDTSLSYAHGGDPAVVVEQYIQGVEFTVDGIFMNGRHHILAISRKTHFDYNANIAKSLFFSFQDPEYDYARLTDQHNRMMNLTGVPFALTHTEYKFENGDFYLIEMAARGGGTLISSHIVPEMCGMNASDYLIRQALGETSFSDFSIRRPKPDQCVVLSFFDPRTMGAKTGDIVRSVVGLDRLAARSDILAYDFEVHPGDEIRLAADDRSRIGYYIASADDREALERVMRDLELAIRIQV